jgi:outer membrane biosynthesis protein TonB
MEPTTQNNTLRSLLIFIIIGAVLLAAVVLGVRWARGRSDQLANAGSQPQTEQPAATETQQEQKPAEQQPAQTQPQSGPVAANPTPAPKPASATQAPTNQPTPTHVPATGVEDAFMPIIAIAAMVFAGTAYVQSRRRLAFTQ